MRVFKREYVHTSVVVVVVYKHGEDCVERESVGISNEMCIVGGRIDWKKIESIAEQARKDRRSRVIFIDES